ncbi:MAG: hypothetical protein H7Y01_15395 [Ferruginibacter sp.]|nr:hypothetical protein [Chitinophagaceae bacterium]
MRYRLLIMILLSPLFSLSQTFEWWRDNVQWDGVTHWGKYIIVSPAYLGPNALSVPLINNGSIDSFASVGLTANAHFSKGDHTQNLMLYGNYTTKKNTIAVDVQFVPYEIFKMSHAIKTERKVYYLNYNDSHTVGDVVVNTTFHLLEKWREKIQLAVRLGFRMPSGRHLGAARYADVPGYWVDIGCGVPLKNRAWKWISMAGFFCWQTNVDTFRQNDAFLFGSGFEWNHKGFRIQGYTAGYTGYKNNGDRPTLLRLNMEKKKNNKIYIFRLQQGLHDFAFFSAEAGAKIIFGK